MRSESCEERAISFIRTIARGKALSLVKGGHLFDLGLSPESDPESVGLAVSDPTAKV